MDFSKIESILDEAIARGIHGCECHITLEGKTVFSKSLGIARQGDTTPFKDSVYYLFSVSKVMTCTAVMQLVEQGKIALDDKVSRFIPELAELYVKEGEEVRPAKTELTIRNLMSMQGGFDYDMYPPAVAEYIEKNGEISTVQAAKLFGKKPLMFDPGTHFAYSLCHDILGAVIEVVSGVEFGEYCKKNIMEPLSMTNSFYATADCDKSNFADLSEQTEESSKFIPLQNYFLLPGTFKSGGAGIVSNGSDYIKFITTLALGGTSPEGVKILSPESIALMKEPQDKGSVHDDFINNIGLKGYGYGLGVRRMIDTAEANSTGTTDEFGWNGAMGSYVVIDDGKKVALFYGQFQNASGYAFDYVHPSLRNALYDAIK